MIKTLPQIIATFLAIGLTFIAAYLIYLYSQQANIDVDIQDEGYKIITFYDEMGLTNSYNQALFSLLPSIINRTYLEKNPNSTKIDILENFYADLIVFERGCWTVNPDDEASKMICNWCERNPILCRQAYIFVIEESLRLMFPSSGTDYGYQVFDKKKYDLLEDEKLLFPYGPLKLDNWLELAERTKKLIYRFNTQHNYSERINGFRKYISSKKVSNYILNYYSDDWFENLKMQSNNINKSVDKIKAFRRLRNFNNIDKRLPNRKWVGLLFLLTFVIGIVIPLLIDAFVVDENIPIIVKVILLTTAFINFSGSCILLYKDITSKKAVSISNDNSNELCKFLVSLETDVERKVFIDFIEINLTLNMFNSDEIPAAVQNKLVKLRADIIATNQRTPILCDTIGKRIASNEILNKYKATIDRSKGFCVFGIPIVKCFMNEKIEPIKNDINIDFYSPVVGEPSTIYLTIRTPKSESETQEIADELQETMKEIIQDKDIEFVQWKNKRENIRKNAKDILEALKTYSNGL